MNQQVFLKIYKKGVVLQIKQFEEEHISIGSDPGVQVQLEGKDSILAWHALIEKKEDHYKVSDLGSLTGIFVNDEKVVEKVLQHGDQIKIGDYMMEFFIGVPFLEAPADSSKEKPSITSSKKVTQPKAPPAKKTSVASKKVTTAKKVATSKTVTPKKSAQAPSSLKRASQQNPATQDLTWQTSQKGGGHPWKKFLSLKPTKRTFAPASSVKDIDSLIRPSHGGCVEVIVTWGERVIATYHSTRSEVITIGSSEQATINVPNLFQKEPYPLVRSGQIAQINFPQGVKGKIITKKRAVSFDFALKKGVITQNSSGQHALSLGQNEVVRVDFHPMLRVYIRHTSATEKAPKGSVFDFNESELLGIGMAVFFMMVFFFYIGVYYPRYMSEEERLDQKKIRIATIDLKPPVRKPPKVLKLDNKTVQVKRKNNIPAKQEKAKKKKKIQVKKQGKPGVVGAVKKTPPQPKPKPKKMTSARSGSSGIQTKKQGSRAKAPKPDPTKVGLLGVFGKGGVKKTLDKTVSGAGELAGLADQSSGFSGNQEAYKGEGVGTKFKNVGAGGKGANLIGISGVSTKGKGGGTEGFGRGGGLGARGTVDLSFGASDIDVEGNVDQNVIRRVIARNKRQLESCYSMVLQKNSSVQGRVRLQWEIEGVRVGGVWVKSNQSGSSQLASCVINRLKTWRFPGAVPAGSKALVTFPFVFIEG